MIRHILYSMMRHMKAQRIFYHKELMLGGVIEMVIWQLPEPTAERPHGLKYRLVYAVDDVRGISKNPNPVAILRCSRNFNAYISNICGALKFISRLVSLRILNF